MTIRFSVRADDLNEALAIVSVVVPRPHDKSGNAGYLFSLRGDAAWVYSRDAHHVARATFPVLSLEGEGAFMYPYADKLIQTFKYFEGKTIAFEVENSEGRYSIKYQVDEAGGELPSFDPKFGQTCDRELADSSHECIFPVAVLREALAMSRDFQAKPDPSKTDDAFQTVQVFDKNLEVPDPKDPTKTIRPCEKGDGYLHASNQRVSIYFHSPEFENKSLTIHSQHVPLVSQFLAKCSGLVKVTTGANKTFMEDAAHRVIGWAHATKQHTRVAHLPNTDDFVFEVEKPQMPQAIGYIATEMPPQGHKIRLQYDDATTSLQLRIAEKDRSTFTSWRIPVRVLSSKERKSFSVNVHIDQFRTIFDGVNGASVEFRILFVPPAPERNLKGGTYLRTVDKFVLDKDGKVIGGSNATQIPDGATLCTVTRFTMSYD